MEKSVFNTNMKLGAVVGKDLASATTGERIKMDNCNRLMIILMVAAGTTGTITPQFKQHNAATSGTSKALAINNDYLLKVGAATVFTKVDLDDTALVDNIPLGTAIGANQAVAAFEILPEDLDTNNGFSYVSVDLPVAGGARIATILYVANGSKAGPAFSTSI